MTTRIMAILLVTIFLHGCKTISLVPVEIEETDTLVSTHIHVPLGKEKTDNYFWLFPNKPGTSQFSLEINHVSNSGTGSQTLAMNSFIRNDNSRIWGPGRIPLKWAFTQTDLSFKHQLSVNLAGNSSGKGSLLGWYGGGLSDIRQMVSLKSQFTTITLRQRKRMPMIEAGVGYQLLDHLAVKIDSRYSSNLTNYESAQTRLYLHFTRSKWFDLQFGYKLLESAQFNNHDSDVDMKISGPWLGMGISFF